MRRRARTLVLALGNDVAGDDGVGLVTARRLRCLAPADVEIEETGEAGLALLDYMTGYEQALILDAVVSHDVPEGTILPFAMSDLRPIRHLSPHYAGLPDVARIAAQHGIPYPSDVRALGVAIRQPETLREGLSPDIELAVPKLMDAALAVLAEWSSALATSARAGDSGG